jgi:hypothetical protein
MKTTYSHFTVKNFLEDIGDDVNFIHIFIRKEDQSLVDMPIMIAYEILSAFIKTIDEPAYRYLQNIKKKAGGYGTKHSKFFEVMLNEGFDLEKYIVAYVEQLSPHFMGQHIEWSENLINPKINLRQAKYLEIYKEL